MPVTSEGSRSGVAWIRLNSPPIERASARASIVLPTPGTPSSRRLPSASRQMAAVSTRRDARDDPLDVLDQTAKAAIDSPTNGSGRLTSGFSTGRGALEAARPRSPPFQRRQGFLRLGQESWASHAISRSRARSNDDQGSRPSRASARPRSISAWACRIFIPSAPNRSTASPSSRTWAAGSVREQPCNVQPRGARRWEHRMRREIPLALSERPVSRSSALRTTPGNTSGANSNSSACSLTALAAPALPLGRPEPGRSPPRAGPGGSPPGAPGSWRGWLADAS